MKLIWTENQDGFFTAPVYAGPNQEETVMEWEITPIDNELRLYWRGELLMVWPCSCFAEAKDIAEGAYIP